MSATSIDIDLFEVAAAKALPGIDAPGPMFVSHRDARYESDNTVHARPASPAPEIECWLDTPSL